MRCYLMFLLSVCWIGFSDAMLVPNSSHFASFYRTGVRAFSTQVAIEKFALPKNYKVGFHDVKAVWKGNYFGKTSIIGGSIAIAGLLCSSRLGMSSPVKVSWITKLLSKAKGDVSIPCGVNRFFEGSIGVTIGMGFYSAHTYAVSLLENNNEGEVL